MLEGRPVDAKKMALAIVVSLAAGAAAVTATAHSRKVLDGEQHVYPPGVLALGQAATTDGCFVIVNAADVAESVPTVDTAGSDRRIAAPDWRFLRLEISVENKSSKPVNLRKLLGRLRIIETSTGKPADTEVVWLRGYDALPQESLPPGQMREGKLAIYLSGYSLIFPFVVQIGDARWGADVIDRNAPVQDML
jgi:hypothetical protein